MLDKLVNVGHGHCDAGRSKACKKYGVSESKILLFNDIVGDPSNYVEVSEYSHSVEAKDVVDGVLAKLPNLKKITAKSFKKIKESLDEADSSTSQPWLFYFTTDAKDSDTLTKD